MSPLKHPDIHHLKAAHGWLELGNHLAANEELENITPTLRSHPDVLETRWGIYSLANNWEAAFDIGCALVEIAPSRSTGWRYRSASLHFMQRSQEAHDLLLAALELFPHAWDIHYDMACYKCGLGDMPAARKLLGKAFELGDKVQHPVAKVGAWMELKSVRELALDDSDLENLWAD